MIMSLQMAAEWIDGWNTVFFLEGGGRRDGGGQELIRGRRGDDHAGNAKVPR